MKKFFLFIFILHFSFFTVHAQFLDVHAYGEVVKSIDVATLDSITLDQRVNMFTSVTPNVRFYYAPSWTQIEDPVMTLEGGVYKVTWIKATSAQWQAQMHLLTGLCTSAYKKYDFRITIKVDRAVKNCTVKIQQDGNDKITYFEEQVNLPTNQEITLTHKGMNGLDMQNVDILVDFGGNYANTNAQISNIVLQESSYDSSQDRNSCPLEGYSLVWNDEFSTSVVNTSKWTYQTADAGWVNHELQTYVAGRSPKGTKVAECSNGTLKIHCFREGDKIYSGRLYGRKAQGFKYGYIEARIKLPIGKGTWPAWWMMPVSGGSWPGCGEIDIMEEVGVDANVVSSSIHCQAYNHPNNTQKTHAMTCPGAENGFHVYALEWTENYIRTYVDGQQQLYFENDGQGNNDTWPFNKAFYPILNLAWGGDWGGYAGVDDSALPVTMEVDYVRVWQRK